MNYPHTTTADPYAFSLWSDASAGSEEMMAWALAAGYAQPKLTVEEFSLDDLDATLAWGQSGTTSAEEFSFQNYSETDWMPGGTVAGDTFGRGVLLSNASAMGTASLAPTTTSHPTDNMHAYIQGLSTCLSGTPSLADVTSLPSPQSDDTGDGVLPFPTFEATSSYFAQQAGLPFPLLDQIGDAAPTWFMGDSNFTGQVLSDFGPFLHPMKTACSAPLDYTQLSCHPGTSVKTLTTTVTVPSSSLGKRSRQSDEHDSGGLKKRRSRVPGGAESTKRTRRSPATRTQQKINCKSKAAGRGAERLVSTTAQGVYPRPLSGHSVPQGPLGVLEHEQPSWVEEREQVVDTRYVTQGSSALLQSAENAEDGVLHKIPGNLTERERSLLQTTQADREQGAVSVIKCKLCPNSPFGTWMTFQRHCKSCEKHPYNLEFCPKCGDYFGRPDSRIRHGDKKHQEECINTPKDEAEAKMEKVERLLEAFEARLKHCLRTGEEIGARFSDVTTRKLTKTSKKVSKTEEIWSEGDSWAAGLC